MRNRSYLLIKKFKIIRYDRAKQLLRRFKNNVHRKILFTDETIFSVEESFNKQNDRVYAQSSEDARKEFPKSSVRPPHRKCHDFVGHHLQAC